jgi:hypothetical protein
LNQWSMTPLIAADRKQLILSAMFPNNPLRIFLIGR